jgi:transposase
VAAFGRVIDKIRNSEYRKASMENKAVFKGAKYLLLKNRGNVRRKKTSRAAKRALIPQRGHQHRDDFERAAQTDLALQVPYLGWQSVRSLVALARSLNHRALNKFAAMLERHRYGILNQCDYPIHTGLLEGVNNKIKVIKRKAYGCHDLRYFTLKIFQVCYN